MNGDSIALLFKVALGFFVVHVLCAGYLRNRLEGDPSLVQRVFSGPLWRRGSDSRSDAMRIQYFWLFTKSPPELATRDLLTRCMFWGARVGGGGFVCGIVALFVGLFLLALQ